MAGTPFPVDETRTGIALAYTNEEMIADQVLPVATPVATKEFTYLKYPIAEGLTVPDTKMGRRSEANTINLTATEEPSATEDFALSDLVPNSDVDNAPQGFDPLNHATETVTELMVLDREIRVANLVFNANTYGAGNKVQLAGADQFSHADSDPFKYLWQRLEIPTVRPNLGVFGQRTWNFLAIHPKMIAGVYGTASTVGKVKLADLADALEIPKLIVGRSRVNTAKKGQAAVLNRTWGPHAAFLHVNALANNQRGMTFGMTVPQGRLRQVRIIDEPKIGIGGSVRVQCESRLKELVTAPDCGFFIQDAVSAA